MSNEHRFNEVVAFKEKLEQVSPTFCSAKWLQSTTLLYNGETHSCHHPTRHKINADDLVGNPSGIHNTPVKFFARKELLEGKQTLECEYCWRIENSNKNNLSDRTYKSASPWAMNKLDQVLASGLGEKIMPTYFEVAFDSTCNLSCMYCSPEVSTQWMGDVERNGPYQLHSITLHDPQSLRDNGKFPIRHDEYNPYIEAFWEWWPELYESLEVFRLTGGEPLLSRHTWAIFDHIKKYPNTRLEFAINTNLCVPEKMIDRLIAEIKEIKDKVRDVKIFTSVEAAGSHAEYIRAGMNYEEFISNIDKIMTALPDVRVVFMTTVNALSAFSFHDFLEDVIILREKHVRSAEKCSLGLSINYLRWPQFQDIRILPKEIKDQATQDIMSIVNAHKTKVPGFGEAMFYLEEIDQIERLVHYMNQDIQNREAMLKDFSDFFNQYDARKGLNFKRTFPTITSMVDPY